MTSTPLVAVAAPTTGRAIAFAAVSYLAFSTADALIKVSSAHHSVFQVALTLSLFALLPVALLTVGQGGLRSLRPARPGLLLLRGALTAIGSVCAWQAFALLPLSDAYAILFLGPILVTALSALMLGEFVGWRRWTAAAIGFGGILMIVNPNFATIGIGHLLALVAAVVGAFSFIVLKKIGTSATSGSILSVLFVMTAAVSLPGAIATWSMPSLHGIVTMALAGLLMGCGQAALVMATREGPAVLVAPFQYSQMIWAIMFGALLFGNPPTPMVFLGMALIIGSGLFTLWREMVRRGNVNLGAARGEVAARRAR